MTIRLKLLFALSFFTSYVLGGSIQDMAYSSEHIQSISSANGFVSYWDILLYILYLLLVVPFIYLGYLNNHKLPANKKPYHFKGEYNAKHIIEYVEGLEVLFGKSFLKFKQLIEEYDKDSEGDLREHAEVMDSIILCIKLNGRKRLTVFWDYSDTFLKAIILLLPVIGVAVVVISHKYFGLSGLVMGLIPMIFIMPIMLTIFSYFLQFSKYIIRKRGKTVPALNLAFFAMEALINRNIKRSYDKITRDYYYHTIIHKYNNEVNANSGFSGVHVRTSSSIYGNLKELTVGRN